MNIIFTKLAITVFFVLLYVGLTCKISQGQKILGITSCNTHIIVKLGTKVNFFSELGWLDQKIWTFLTWPNIHIAQLFLASDTKRVKARLRRGNDSKWKTSHLPYNKSDLYFAYQREPYLLRSCNSATWFSSEFRSCVVMASRVCISFLSASILSSCTWRKFRSCWLSCIFVWATFKSCSSSAN